MYNKETNDAISTVKQKMADGKKLTMKDKILMRMADGEWHEAADLAYNVSWRFGGYLHTLKREGVNWEKERVPNVAAVVYMYRLVDLDED